ncbi:MAG TPA: hypothetical protein VGG34_01240 [Opitutaceae bacterium]
MRSPYPRYVAALSAAVLLGAASLVVLLNRQGILRLGWARQGIDKIRSDSGFASVARTGRPDLSSDTWPSPALVLENGVPLKGPANSLHADIRSLGGGRYSFWHRDVYFSSSDNTNPAANGRRYSILYPRMAGELAAYALYLATFASWASLLAFSRRHAASEWIGAAWAAADHAWGRIRRNPLPAALLLLLAAFLASRLPFFLRFPAVGQDSDTLVYIAVARAIRHSHHWPTFLLRTPGYPLFILLVHLFSAKWIAVVAAQGACSLASMAVLLVAVRRLCRALVLPAAVALCGYATSSTVLKYETSILADSLYATMVILSLSLILLALAEPGRARWFLASSLAVAATILVRPVGLYLVVICLLLAAYALWNRLPARVLAALLVPFPTILLGFCAYNYATLGSFSISLIGRMALAAATAPYIEPDPALSPQMNRVLAQVMAANQRAGITQADMRTLREGWRPGELYPIFEKPFNFVLDQDRYRALFDEIVNADFAANLAELGHAETLAIRRHPALYAKFVATNLDVYFTTVEKHEDFLGEIGNRQAQPSPAAWDPGDPQRPRRPRNAGVRASGRPGGLAGRVQMAVQGWQAMWFRSGWWLAAYAAAALFGAVQVVRNRGRHPGSFALALVALVPIGAALTTCLCNISIPRYVFPTEFACYLSVALVPLAWGARRPDGARPAPTGSPPGRAG